MQETLTYTSDYYINNLDALKERENAILDEAIPIPLSTFCGEDLAAAIKKNLVFNWTGRLLRSEKETLHEIARERTVLKMQRIKKKLERIPKPNTDNPNLRIITELVDSTGYHEKRNIRTALEEVKNFTKNAKGHSLKALAGITEILSEEYRDCAYKPKPQNEDESSFSLPHKISSNTSKTAKFLNNVFTFLALTGAILSLLALFFPLLVVLAAGTLTVGTIGICLCSIVLSLKRLVKMVVNRFYFGVPIDGWELLLNIFNLAISVIFVMVGISSFMPASDSSFMSYLPDVIKNLVTYVYASVTAAKNFLEAKVSVEILINIWRIIVGSAELAGPIILQGGLVVLNGLSWLYQRTRDGIQGGRIYISPRLPSLYPYVRPISNAASFAWTTVSTAVNERVAATSEYLFPSSSSPS